MEQPAILKTHTRRLHKELSKLEKNNKMLRKQLDSTIR